MTVIETNWDVQRKDLKLFGTIGTVVFGILAIGKIAGIAAMSHYADRLFSWQLMAAVAVLSVIGAILPTVPARSKKYGVIGAVLFGALSAGFYTHLLGPSHWAFIGLAVFCAIGAMGSELIRPLYMMALIATFPIGMVVGPIIMAAIFFLIFTPVALIFKLIGRDTMTRKFDHAASTYWIERRPTTDVKRYFRQF